MAKILKFSNSFKKFYKKLPVKIQNKVDKQLIFMVDNPSHPSLNIHLIERTGGIWEGYIDSSYRFTFEIREDCDYLRVVGSHKIIDLEAKRKFKKNKTI